MGLIKLLQNTARNQYRKDEFMAVNCGIVGLPNVGKSTLFNALTSAPAEAANYPFCTIEPNVGIVSVNDERLNQIAELITPERTIPTSVEFVDIAGLVKGASKGEGLGNQFLGHIRQVNAIIHVVRCFEDDDIIHVAGRINPIEDIETINLELALADLEVVERKLVNMPKLLKNQNKEIQTKAKIQQPLLEKLQVALSDGIAARAVEFSAEDKEAVSDLSLITMKQVLYLCNVDEAGLESDNEFVTLVKDYAKKEGADVVTICGKLESEIASLDTIEERKEFMEAAGIEVSGLERLTKIAYDMLGLKTYFTAGVKEVRAWTFHDGYKAPQAAGVIHTDFERGFIKAEVFHCSDLFQYKTEQKVKEAGKFRVEGKEYVVKDGDIMHFRFNV
jgi:ribosome-binding ATPase